MMSPFSGFLAAWPDCLPPPSALLSHSPPPLTDPTSSLPSERNVDCASPTVAVLFCQRPFFAGFPLERDGTPHATLASAHARSVFFFFFDSQPAVSDCREFYCASLSRRDSSQGRAAKRRVDPRSARLPLRSPGQGKTC